MPERDSTSAAIVATQHEAYGALIDVSAAMRAGRYAEAARHAEALACMCDDLDALHAAEDTHHQAQLVGAALRKRDRAS